jgi:hypothetical protein
MNERPTRRREWPSRKLAKKERRLNEKPTRRLWSIKNLTKKKGRLKGKPIKRTYRK